jgi:acyl-CoA thioesterase-1
MAWLVNATSSAFAETLRLLAFGDSLTAGFGVRPAESFPSRLEAALRQEGYDVRVINAGVSGDTTAGGRSRIGWALAEKPHAAILELGANDMLRGVDPRQTMENLDAILAELKASRAKILLAGFKAPRNLGLDFAREFDAIYPALAKKHGIDLYPFFLEGIALKPELNQGDGLHPTAKGVDSIVRGILPQVRKLLDGVKG